jgi:hypothetical protein
MSTRKLNWLFCSLALCWCSSPVYGIHLEARGGVVTSFQGQSLALEHRLKPKASMEVFGEWSPGVFVGAELLSHPDPLPGYLLVGGMGTLRLNVVSWNTGHWNLLFGAGVGNAPDILFNNLDGRSQWTLLAQGGTELRIPVFGSVSYTLRILSENLLMVSLESGFAAQF